METFAPPYVSCLRRTITINLELEKLFKIREILLMQVLQVESNTLQNLQNKVSEIFKYSDPETSFFVQFVLSKKLVN